MISSILHLFDLSAILNLFFQNQDAPIEAIKLFGIKLMNPTDFWSLILRFSINLLVTITLVRFIYFKGNKKKEYFFIYFLMNTIVFLICFSLMNTSLEMGFALGLFAIFGIIRYRTDPIPIKEMTYLFLVVGVAVINGLAGKKTSYAELLLVNIILIVATWYLEKIWMRKQLNSLRINYEKIELIHPAKKEELIADLKERTGLDVQDAKVERINFLRDSARLSVSYKSER